MAEPLRHRQTKEAETDMPGLPPPRHIPTLPLSPSLPIWCRRPTARMGRASRSGVRAGRSGIGAEETVGCGDSDGLLPIPKPDV